VSTDGPGDELARRLADAAARLDDDRLWAASGAMALTGDADGPALRAPAPVAAVVQAAGDLVGVAPGVDEAAPGVHEAPGLDAPGLLHDVHSLDAPGLLGERAAVYGFARRGRISCGGGARLLRAADDTWLAVALPRPVDRDAVPAWLATAIGAGDPWPAVADAVAGQAAADLLERARLLEIPCARVGEARAPAPWRLIPGPAGPPRPPGLLVDLSALWAGPLCASLLASRAARVVKVEDPARPDGTRAGPRQLLDLLNGGKESVALALATADGRRSLHRLLDAADIVVTSSRPRAFEALGVDVPAILRRSPTVWVAITAHGWDGPGRDRVGFGDDAAVAGGLVATGPDGGPRFLADAVADPLTGVLAAVVGAELWARGGSWFVDASLAAAAAWVRGLGPGGMDAGPPRRLGPGGSDAGRAREGTSMTAAPPRARTSTTAAHALGADTAAVLDRA